MLPDHVERLTLLQAPDSGSGLLGAGNAGNNILLGLGVFNVLSGLGGNDVLITLGRNETLIGNDGDDVYVVGRGAGLTFIDQYVPPFSFPFEMNSGGSDTLLFRGAIGISHLWFTRRDDDLEIRILGGADSVLLTGWYSRPEHRLTRIVLPSGHVLLAEQVDALVAGMAALTAPLAEQSAMSSQQLQALSGLLAASWRVNSIKSNIAGTAGDDILLAGSGGDTLLGGAGDDILIGSAGMDVLHGGAGANVMMGGAGLDTYYVSSELDQIIEFANEGQDMVWSTVSFTLPDHVEILRLQGTSDIDGTGNELNNVLMGNAGANILRGGAGNDILLGAEGDDILIGGSGNDSYSFRRGDGTDRLIESSFDAGNEDTLVFGTGIEIDQLWFQRVGDDLGVQIIGTDSRVLVDGWYGESGSGLDQFKILTKTLMASQVQVLVDAMAAFSPPASGQTSLPPAYQTALAPVIAASWQ